VIERVAAGRYELVIERPVERVLPATRRHMPSSICSADEPSFSRLLAQSSLTCYTRAHNLRSACGLQWPLSASAFCRDSCFTRPHIVWRCVYSKATRKAMRNSSSYRPRGTKGAMLTGLLALNGWSVSDRSARKAARGQPRGPTSRGVGGRSMISRGTSWPFDVRGKRSENFSGKSQRAEPPFSIHPTAQ
jgi:hypothetical protein